MSHIQIEKLALHGHTIDFSFSVSADIRRFFLTRHLHYEYDVDISAVPPSILYIPAVANVIHVGWALGCQIRVEELDRDFAESLAEIETIAKKTYSQFRFAGDTLRAEKTVRNRFAGDRYTLLFSGGIDSLASYITHREKRPILCTFWFWGTDTLAYEKRHWEIARENFFNFCGQESLDGHVVQSNLWELLDDRKLAKKTGLRFWLAQVSHGLVWIASLAPLVVQQSQAVIIAGGATDTIVGEWGSMPEADSKIRIADIRTIHDGDTSSRQKKIHSLVAKHPELFKFITVCFENGRNLNCSRCEKCIRTITGFALAGVDPNCCNFKISGQDLQRLIRKFEKGALSCQPTYHVNLWDEFKKFVPADERSLPLAAPDFFRWLKEYDFRNHRVSPFRRRLNRWQRKMNRLRWHRLMFKGKKVYRQMKAEFLSRTEKKLPEC